MNFRNKRIITVLVGLVITSSTLLLAINVQSLPSNTQNFGDIEKIYLDLRDGGIEGTSTDAGHEYLIDIYQYSHNIYASKSSAQGAGTVSHTPLTVVKLVDEASVRIWETLTIGLVYPRVQVLFYNTGGITPYFNITLTSAQVISILSDADTSTHFEMISFIYGTIYWTDGDGVMRSSTWS